MPIDFTRLLFFSTATLMVVISPGPGMLFVISRSLSGGRKVGVIAALGTSTGIAVHIAIAAFGLSLIIYASNLGFVLTKWIGGLYLLFLAWKSFSQNETLAPGLKKDSLNFMTIFWQGILVNSLNPKVALFFLAFIPQFIDPLSGSVPLQTIALGTVFMVFTIIVFAGYGLCASIIRRWIVDRPKANRTINWAVAGLFFFLGIRLVLSTPN
jgi:threonine/homoserine/homoserine lactone efflux protein